MKRIPTFYHPVGDFLKKSMFAVIVFLSALTGCGYRPLVNVDGDKALTVYMPMWINQTSELGLEAMIFQAVANRVKRTERVRLTTSPEAAAYELSGTIQSLASPGLSYGEADQARELNAQLTVGFTLKEKASGKPVLEEKGYTMAEPYFVGTDAVRTRSNRRQVLDKIAKDLAEDILQRFLDFSPE